MQPLAFLRCVGKALVRHAGNALGLGFGGDILAKVGEEVWKEWQRERNALERREELQAVAQAAAAEVRAQVDAIVREVAAEKPAAVRDRVARYLEQIPLVVRSHLRRPEDPSGTTVPPDFSIVKSQDLLPLISLEWATAPPAGPRGDEPAPSEPAPTEPKPAAPATVILTAVQGPLRGQRFVFDERTTCIIGRDPKDCQARIPDDKAHQRISRRHCLLDINPPGLRVRDFGSRNGTFVNDELIGKRHEGMTPEEGARLQFPEKDLRDGDRLTLSETVFQVEVRGAAAPTETYPQGRRCPRCGGDVMGEAGDRVGVFLCAECRADPEQLAKHLVALANAGQAEVQALKGYRVVKTLGKGGMGAVFLLGTEPAKDWLALKLMLPRIAADERARARFLREIDAARALRHRHVVPLRAAGEHQGTFFFTMDYCDGGSAHDLQQQRGGKLPLDEALEITLQALEGLEHAHNVFGPGKGLVHRDLSPHNLLLSGSGAARIARIGDYGLAKAFDQAGLSGLTRTGDAAGKPHFMPRQQVVDFKYAQPAVDVWAMAACLYSMLTGAAPRDFPAGKDKWLVVLESDPAPIRERDPNVPKELAAVIDRALVDRGELQFQTAAQFKEALEGAA